MAAPRHRSFTVRIPTDLYFEVANVATADSECLNVTVNKLLKLGLGKHVDLTTVLQRMIIRAAAEEGVA